ncbi:uncharacterized protein LOC111126415 [Crassostrea virginica]
MSTTDWPDVVGLPWKEAEKKIRSEYPKIAIQVLPEGSCVTMDYRTDRVRLYTDGDGKVVQVPSIG